MCTGLSMQGSKHYFGRNLDLEYDFGQQVIITPRHYSFCYSAAGSSSVHYACVGMGTVMQDYPLYADAINEKGLGMAGLHFALSGKYPAVRPDAKHEVAPYEFIPWLLGQCATLKEAEDLVLSTSMSDLPFSPQVPNSMLHWMISDSSGSLVVEPVDGRLVVEKNPFGVLTNDPPFSFHSTNLNWYLNLTAEPPTNRFGAKELTALGKGTGAVGLPGDCSPMSRFVRIAFNASNSVCDAQEADELAQFFHLLDSVASVKGAVRTEDGKYFITRYSSCMTNGRYIYKTYANNQLTEIDMYKTDLDTSSLTVYPLIDEQQIRCGN